MAQVPTPEQIAASIKVRERVVLLCVAGGGAEWKRLGVAGDAPATLTLKGLIDSEAEPPLLTERGREVVAALQEQVANFKFSRDASMAEPQSADEGSIPSPAHQFNVWYPG